MYQKKIAYLVSLICRLKEFSSEELQDSLGIEEVEELLNMPNVADRDWNNASLRVKRMFSRFLNAHIIAYEEILNHIEKEY